MEVDAGPGIRELLADVIVNPDGSRDYDPRVIDMDDDEDEAGFDAQPPNAITQ